MWALHNLTGEEQHRFAALIMELDERADANHAALVKKYPITTNILNTQNND